MKWVLTVFEQDTYHMYEFDTIEEAQAAFEKSELPGIITYTSLSLAA